MNLIVNQKKIKSKMSDTDPSAPWYEFLSYIRCCESLEVTPSIRRFMGYQRYYKEVVLNKKHYR